MRKVLVLNGIVFLMILLPLLCWAQESVSEKAKWLEGSWTGFQDWSKTIWGLEISNTANPKILDDKIVEYNGEYKIGEQKPSQTTVTLKGDRVIFNTYSKAKFELDRVSNNRMDGEMTTSNGKKYRFRFWKTGDKILTENQKINPLFRSWEGTWQNGLAAQLTFEYIDDTGASCLYGPGGEIWKNVTLGSGYVNATITLTPYDTQLEFPHHDRGKSLVFRFSPDKLFEEWTEGVTRGKSSVTMRPR
ncbi:MAG: hypothetical protein WCO26_14785 [Deltaproteobacteria bacterium]